MEISGDTLDISHVKLCYMAARRGEEQLAIKHREVYPL